jgi:hypothetical protein
VYYGILPSDGRRSRSASSGISGLSSMPATTPGSDDDENVEGGISDNAGEGNERDQLNKARKIDLKKQQYFGGGSKAKGTSVRFTNFDLNLLSYPISGYLACKDCSHNICLNLCFSHCKFADCSCTNLSKEGGDPALPPPSTPSKRIRHFVWSSPP